LGWPKATGYKPSKVDGNGKTEDESEGLGQLASRIVL